jgi:hypothetical protein
MNKTHRGIVIACTEKSRPFYEELVKTLKTPYPILFSWEGAGRDVQSHEYGAVAQAKELFDEFVFLHDSVLIKDNSLFDKLFYTPGHVALTAGFYHLMGKFISADLPEIPVVHTKRESIEKELGWFTKPYSVFPEQLPYISNVFEFKNGRNNMVLENSYMVKYKGHWSMEMADM